MEESKPTLPKFDSVEDLAEFFDSNDMGDYLEGMPEANFDVSIKRRRFLVEIDETLMKKMAEIAKSQHVSAEKLIHSWLEEKARNAA